jgi:hypothetical protein
MSTAMLSPSATLSTVVGSRLDGIVGYIFLRNYKVAFDYPNATLSLFHA